MRIVSQPSASLESQIPGIAGEASRSCWLSRFLLKKTNTLLKTRDFPHVDMDQFQKIRQTKNKKTQPKHRIFVSCRGQTSKDVAISSPETRCLVSYISSNPRRFCPGRCFRKTCTPNTSAKHLLRCARVDQLLVLGMVIQPLIGNPYNGYINPYYWVDDHPLLYGNNGSLDPSTDVHQGSVHHRLSAIQSPNIQSSHLQKGIRKGQKLVYLCSACIHK